MLPKDDLQSIFGIQDLIQYAKAKASLPASLTAAVATQLVETIRKADFDALPFPWKYAATEFLSAQQQEELWKTCPGLRIFTDSYHKDMNAMRDHWQVFFKKSSNMEQFLLKLQTDHAAVHLTDDVVRVMDSIMDDRGRATTRKILATSSQMTELHSAAWSGGRREIQAQLRTTRINTLALPHAWTPLHSAVLGKNLKAVKYLLQSGADVNAQLKPESKWTLTPLILAVLNGDVNIVQSLLSQPGIDVWARDAGYFSFTSAHYAAELSPSGKLLACLIKHDPSLVEAKDARRRTPLHRACLKGHIHNVKLLVSAGADIESRDDGDSTPLHRAYAAAGGLQGLLSIENDTERTRETIQTHEYSMPPSTRQFLGSLMTPFAVKTLEFPPEMLAAYQSLAKETPPGHAAFYQIWKSFSPGMDQIYDQMASMLEIAIASEPLPHVKWDREEQVIEVNVHQLLERQKRCHEIGAHAKAKGQKGVTYLSPGSGRDIVYFLLEQGASTTAINKSGYAPEGYSYRPRDLNWNIGLQFAELATFEPKSCFRTVECSVRSSEEEPWSAKVNTLCLRPVRNGFSVWFWLNSVLPCPGDLCLTFTARRRSQRIQTQIDALLQRIDNQEVVIEVQMHPPNDARDKQETLFKRGILLLDLLPEADKDYSVFAGFVPLKHKCDLLINIRSSEPSGAMPALCFYSLALQSRKTMTQPASLWPLGDTTSHQPLSSFDWGDAGTDLLPKFPFGTHWLPQPPAALKKKSGRFSDALKTTLFSSLSRHSASPMTLKKPNPGVYTRPELGRDENQVMQYGEKTWHFKEKRNDWSHWEIGLISDGVDQSTVLEIGAMSHAL